MTLDERRLSEPTMPATPYPEPDMPAPATGFGAPPGVVILGGAHGTLALARSLGRKGVPVWLVSDDTPLPALSCWIAGRRKWAGPDTGNAAGFLLDLAATEGLQGALLVPGGDREVRFAAGAVDLLSGAYRIMLPPWQRLKRLCEKPLLYRCAEELGVAIPRTYRFTSQEEAAAADVDFPVVLKPNMGGGDNRFSRAKAVRADDRTTFLAAYRDAADQIGFDNIVIQQLVPGGGENQFSYTALWWEGRPLAEFTARRTRQYPVDFGYTSSFVEIADVPEAVEASRKLLASIAHHGLVEIEFKRDPQDGTLRLFDVNPRCWSWFGLAAAAGVDLGGLLWDMANGRPVAAPAAKPGTAWMYLARDMVAAATLAWRGELGAGAYLRSFGAVRSWATFAGDDPLPGLGDMPLTLWRVLTRRVFR